VTFWAQLFLGIIAIATLVMAIVHVCVIMYGWTLARRLLRLMDQIELDMKPIVDNLNAMARDAARATALAAVQVERVDTLFLDLTSKIEQTAATVQRAILTPLREGAAVMAGLKAVMAVLKDLRRSSGSGARTEEEDALFIG
jgi:hypothetical protein